jgi:hypothetical protein
LLPALRVLPHRECPRWDVDEFESDVRCHAFRWRWIATELAKKSKKNEPRCKELREVHDAKELKTRTGKSTQIW